MISKIRHYFVGLYVLLALEILRGAVKSPAFLQALEPGCGGTLERAPQSIPTFIRLLILAAIRLMALRSSDISKTSYQDCVTIADKTADALSACFGSLSSKLGERRISISSPIEVAIIEWLLDGGSRLYGQMTKGTCTPERELSFCDQGDTELSVMHRNMRQS